MHCSKCVGFWGLRTLDPLPIPHFPPVTHSPVLQNLGGATGSQHSPRPSGKGLTVPFPKNPPPLSALWVSGFGFSALDLDPGEGRGPSSPFVFLQNTRCSAHGDRSLAVVGPHVWNSLPAIIRQITSYGQFRQYLKTHLFRA